MDGYLYVNVGYVLYIMLLLSGRVILICTYALSVYFDPARLFLSITLF